MANDSKDSILKNTGLITLCTLGSRVTGLLRTWAMAFALGNTLLTSAYQIAYNMPSMIYELAASGLLATAFLPLYLLQKEKKGDGEAYKFASNILTLTIVLGHPGACLFGVFSAGYRDADLYRRTGRLEDLGHLLLPYLCYSDFVLWRWCGYHGHLEC